MPGRVCVQSQFKTHSKSQTTSGYIIRHRHLKKKRKEKRNFVCVLGIISALIERKRKQNILFLLFLFFTSSSSSSSSSPSFLSSPTLVFLRMDSTLYSTHWPGTYYGIQAGLKFVVTLLASRGLELQACSTVLGFFPFCYTVFPCNQRLCVSHKSLDYKRQKPNSNQFMPKGEKPRGNCEHGSKKARDVRLFPPIRIAFLFPFVGTIFLPIDFILNKSVPSR